MSWPFQNTRVLHGLPLLQGSINGGWGGREASVTPEMHTEPRHSATSDHTMASLSKSQPFVLELVYNRSFPFTPRICCTEGSNCKVFVLLKNLTFADILEVFNGRPKSLSGNKDARTYLSFSREHWSLPKAAVEAMRPWANTEQRWDLMVMIALNPPEQDKRLGQSGV